MDLSYYQALLQQPARLAAFRQAIGAVVRPGDRVLEVGAGVGTYAFLAAQAGAARVWAVDGEPVIHVAAELARANGLADRVHCLRGWVPDVRPPEPVDVVIYEDFSPQLLEPRTWRLYRDLHAHCAARGARWVPAQARLHLALAEDAGASTRVPPPEALGIAWAGLVPYLANLPVRGGLQPRDLLSAPVCAVCVSFGQPVTQWPSAGGGTLRATRAGTVGALAMWHTLDLADGIALDNAPGAVPASWGHVVLPLSAPVSVRAGDAVDAAVRWTATFDGAPAWLGWRVACQGAEVGGNAFAGVPASRRDLLAGSPDWRPRPGSRTGFVQDVLALTDGRRTAREIADALGSRYPAGSAGDLTARVLAVLSQAGALCEGERDT